MAVDIHSIAWFHFKEFYEETTTIRRLGVLSQLNVDPGCYICDRRGGGGSGDDFLLE